MPSIVWWSWQREYQAIIVTSLFSRIITNPVAALLIMSHDSASNSIHEPCLCAIYRSYGWASSSFHEPDGCTFNRELGLSFKYTLSRTLRLQFQSESSFSVWFTNHEPYYFTCNRELWLRLKQSFSETLCLHWTSSYKLKISVTNQPPLKTVATFTRSSKWTSPHQRSWTHALDGRILLHPKMHTSYK